MLKMNEIDLSGKRVLIRVDLNVPMSNGIIENDSRIKATIPTIKLALQSNCSIILMSHMGRPREGIFEEDFSLNLVAENLSSALRREVRFISNWDNNFDINNGDIVLMENVRFLKGEKNNDPDLSKKMGELCDIFVMDAFASAHRSHASTCGVIEFAKIACIGPLFSYELESLQRIFSNPKRPLLAIVGGSKISTKLEVITSLAKSVDYLILGGGIANTVLKAMGYEIGSSLYEESMLVTAKLLSEDTANNCVIPEIFDVLVARKFSVESKAILKNIEDVSKDDLILDIGPKTVKKYEAIIEKAATIIWNGPVGVFEFDEFSQGTKNITNAIMCSNGYSAAGGGDTIAAIDKFDAADGISYISTGGGAFLEFIENKTLPSAKALEIHGDKLEKGP
tara:strand:- start:2016 stop:3200 length:1185 start_codon:yes stop_codon:yes gene_type:complete